MSAMSTELERLLKVQAEGLELLAKHQSSSERNFCTEKFLQDFLKDINGKIFQIEQQELDELTGF